MNTDIRIKVSFLNHRKRKKLQRALGADGVLAFIDLMLSAAINRPDGVFSGYDNTDICIDAQWDGDGELFVNTLLSIGLLDQLENGNLAIHDWLEHNGWAADSNIRSDIGRFSNLKRYFPLRAKELEKEGVTAISVEDYAAIKKEEEARGNRSKLGTESVPSRADVDTNQSPSPPSPFPSSPSPSPEQSRAGKRFSPPSLESVTTYCKERGNNVDPVQWHSFYASKGWMVGKNKMVDWRKAVITWESREKESLEHSKQIQPRSVKDALTIQGEEIARVLNKERFQDIDYQAGATRDEDLPDFLREGLIDNQ